MTSALVVGIPCIVCIYVSVSQVFHSCEFILRIFKRFCLKSKYSFIVYMVANLQFAFLSNAQVLPSSFLFSAFKALSYIISASPGRKIKISGDNK